MNEARFTPQDRFEIAGEEFLQPLQAESVPVGSQAQVGTTGGGQGEALEDIRVRPGDFAQDRGLCPYSWVRARRSIAVGYSSELCRCRSKNNLHGDGITGGQRPRMGRWLPVFYLAVRCSGGDDSTPMTRNEILARRVALNGGSAAPLQVNFERVLATLHRWRSALPETGGRLRSGRHAAS